MLFLTSIIVITFGINISIISFLGFLGFLHGELLLFLQFTISLTLFLTTNKKPKIIKPQKHNNVKNIIYLLNPFRKERCILSIIIITILILLAVISFSIPPLNFDSNTYRLSRIAYWLQESNIYSFETNDHRMNYTGHNADLNMLWVLIWFKNNYQHAAIIQFIGGLLCCTSIYEITRLANYKFQTRILTVLIFIGIPSVSCQFITTQFDLFTAGTLTAGIAILHSGLRKKDIRIVSLAGIAFGITLGAKAVVAFLGIPCMLYYISCLFLYKIKPIQTLKYSMVLSIFCLIFAFPPFLKNWITYHNVFGNNHDFVVLTGHNEKNKIGMLKCNLLAYTWQSLEPSSQAPGVNILTKTAFDMMETFISETKGYPENFQRNVDKAKENFYNRNRLTEDSVSFGIIVVLLFTFNLAFIAFAWRKLDNKKIPIILFGLGIIPSLIVFSMKFIYMPYNFRFFIISAPMFAIFCSLAINSLKNKSTALRIASTLLTINTILITGKCLFQNNENGIRSAFDHSYSKNWGIYKSNQRILDNLHYNTQQLSICAPRDTWLTPFFRNNSNVNITFLKKEKLNEHETPNELMSQYNIESLAVHKNNIPIHWHDFNSEKIGSFYLFQNSIEQTDQDHAISAN